MAAFLQNNGDIILDAVLTDYGRKLLAKGDGSFNIVKFSLGDDEIDYGLFKPENSSLTKDIDIVNTPILEAFTNNAASMKSQLLTMSLQNVLYMPILKLGTKNPQSLIGKFGDVFEGYVIPVDYLGDNNENNSSKKLRDSNSVYLNGVQLSSVSTHRIIVEQGLDSPDLDPNKSLRSENPVLYEEEYSVYVDSRFCSLLDLENISNTLNPLSTDDDGIAVYKFSQPAVVSGNSAVQQIPINTENNSVIEGTKGSMLQFKIAPNLNLKNQDTFFIKYGKTLTLNGTSFLTLRTMIRVMGNTTGYSIDIPVLFAKYKVV